MGRSKRNPNSQRRLKRLLQQQQQQQQEQEEEGRGHDVGMGMGTGGDGDGDGDDDNGPSSMFEIASRDAGRAAAIQFLQARPDRAPREVMGIPTEYWFFSMEMRGKLYGMTPRPSTQTTTSTSAATCSCQHGMEELLERRSEQDDEEGEAEEEGEPGRESALDEAMIAIQVYFAARALDENNGYDLDGWTIFQYLYRYGGMLNEDHAKITLADAAVHTLNRNYGYARIMQRLFARIRTYLDHGKPDIPFEAGDLSDMMSLLITRTPLGRYLAESSKVVNQVETPEEVAKYIQKYLPSTCNCLGRNTTSMKDAKAKSEQWGGQCVKCSKRGPIQNFKQCSKCHSATYCSRDCQVADWTIHKVNCRLLRGKNPLADMNDIDEQIEIIKHTMPEQVRRNINLADNENQERNDRKSKSSSCCVPQGAGAAGAASAIPMPCGAKDTTTTTPKKYKKKESVPPCAPDFGVASSFKLRGTSSSSPFIFGSDSTSADADAGAGAGAGASALSPFKRESSSSSSSNNSSIIQQNEKEKENDANVSVIPYESCFTTS